MQKSIVYIYIMLEYLMEEKTQFKIAKIKCLGLNTSRNAKSMLRKCWNIPEETRKTLKWMGQNMPPQNRPLWHQDYFQLKTPENQQMQEGVSDLPFSSWKQIKLPCERCLFYTRRKEHFYHQRWSIDFTEKSVLKALLKIMLISH